MRAKIVAAFAIIVAVCTAATNAQTAVNAASAVQIEVERVRRGLELQHMAAIIKERRLADDRELAALEVGEARLKAARAAFDQGLAGAVAELETARSAYADLVVQVEIRDSAARAEIEAYKAEARQIVGTSSTERLVALQRFADGDRTGAWPVLESLRLAEDKAIEAVSNLRRAARWREDAELREIMRLNGEADVAEVDALWRMAATLDPGDARAQLGRARLFFSICSKDRLQSSLELARALAGAGGSGNETLSEVASHMSYISYWDTPYSYRLESAFVDLFGSPTTEQILRQFEVAKRMGDRCADLKSIGDVEYSEDAVQQEIDRTIELIEAQQASLLSKDQTIEIRQEIALRKHWLADALARRRYYEPEAKRSVFEIGTNINESYYAARENYADAAAAWRNLGRSELDPKRKELLLTMEALNTLKLYELTGYKGYLDELRDMTRFVCDCAEVQSVLNDIARNNAQ